MVHDGTTIGPYRVLRKIGEGGCGVVYAAEQTEPFRRAVALKVIKEGMDTKQVVARFEAERQALALMNHAGIAKIYAAGATEGGRPYFAMEHIDGSPITDYADQHQLSTNERLQLFLEVCDAIVHAHQRGIIHRDLKPSNVLVAEVDERALPRIIDFGIAKAMGSDLTEHTLFTERGQLIGTPEYMSPEQAENSAAVDTRTDIYSLGVLLYELLTGQTPFDPETLREGTIGDIQERIRATDPPKPSTRVSTRREGTKTVAQTRRTEPRALVRRLRGDLDWIVMKALEKDRSRRYASASEFAADIERHRNGEVVLAGPPSAAYRASKFVRRNRAAVTVAALVFFALVAGAVGTTMMAFRAEAARALEVEQRRMAEREAVKASAVLDFFFYALAFMNPSHEEQVEELTVIEMLRRAETGLPELLSGRPLAAACVRGMLGIAYFNNLRMDDAAEQLDEATRLYETLPEASDPRTSDEEPLIWLAFRSSASSSRGESEEAFKKHITKFVDFAVMRLEPEFPKLARRMDEAWRYLRDRPADLDAARLRVEAGSHLRGLLDCLQMPAAEYPKAFLHVWPELASFAPQPDLWHWARREQLRMFLAANEARRVSGSHVIRLTQLLISYWNVARAQREDALEVAKALMKLVERWLPPSQWFRGDAQSVYGLALARRGSHFEGEEHSLRGTNVVLNGLEPGSIWGIQCILRLGSLYREWGMPREARRGPALDPRALKFMEAADRPPSDWAALALAFCRSDRVSLARRALVRAREIESRAGTEPDPITIRLIAEVEAFLKKR